MKNRVYSMNSAEKVPDSLRTEAHNRSVDKMIEDLLKEMNRCPNGVSECAYRQIVKILMSVGDPCFAMGLALGAVARTFKEAYDQGGSLTA